MRWIALIAMLLAPARSNGAEAEVATRDGPPSTGTSAPAASTHWYAFGAPFYLPETRAGLGLVAGVHRVLCPGCQPSSVHVETAYTMNGQFTITIAPRLFVDPSFSLGLSARYANFPDRFYGIGPGAPAVGEAFTPRTIELMITPELYVIPGRLRVGPKVHVRREEILAREAGGQLASGSVYGGDGYSAIGIGASVTWDARDSQFFPRTGTYLELWFLQYPGPIGHHPDFGRAAIDGSWFLPLGGDHVLALDASAAATTGTAPFTLLAPMGGVHTLRGYRDGWYRDRFSYGVQAEWRFPILGRLRGVVFGGIGDVAPRLTAFGLDTVRAAGGAGVRFRLTSDGVFLRADLASRGDEPDLYMLVLEAF